MNLENVSAGKI